MVHYLDLSKVLDNIVANPTAYGITSGLVCPTFPNTTCVVSSKGYLFYGDALHLTTDGFRIVAAYIARQLEAPLTLQAPSDVGLDLAKQWGRTLTSRLDAGAPRDGGEATGVRIFAVGDSSARRVDATDRTDEYRLSMWGATGGVEFGFGNGAAGLAVNYSKPRANFGNDASDDSAKSVQVGGYAGVAMGGAFVQGYAGYGWDKHDIARAGVVEGMSASPKGRHYGAGLKGGYLMPLGGFRIGPVAALDYAKAKVDGYTESGDAALTLNVSSINVKSLRGSVGIEARGDMETGGLQLRPYGSALIEKDFSGDGRTFLFSQTASPVIVNSWSVDDISKKAYGRINTGFNAELGGGVSLDVGGSLTVGKKQGNETSGQLGLRVGF
jgi:outer membrane autotransporter protein